MRTAHWLLLANLALGSTSALAFDASGFSPLLGKHENKWTDLPKALNDDFSDIHAGLTATRMERVFGNLHPETPVTTRGGKEASLYSRLSPSVVLVVTEDGLGSGTVISPDGHILTNWHVLGGADWAGIVLKPKQDGKKITKADIRYAKVIKVDEVADLALLKLIAPPANLTSVTLGSGDLIQIGADVHVIGHPTGETWTYTKGFISQVRKGYSWESNNGPKHTADVLQTQTPINPGNSGGPLFSDDGKLIGVTTFKVKGEGLNFAVSVDEVHRFLKQTSNVNVTARVEKARGCKAQAAERERMTIRGKEGYATLIDKDCDDVAEAVLFEPDDKNEPITVFIETKKYITVTFDFDRDGRWDKTLVYQDPKGSPLLVGLHPDGKLKPSSFEPYKK